MKDILLNKEYLTAQEIVYLSLGCPDMDIPTEEVSTNCSMCGQPVETAIPRKKVLSGNFTNYDSLKLPHSDYFCLPCTFSFKEKAPDGRTLKGRSFAANPTEFRLLDDNESLAEVIYKPLEPPFIICIGRFKGAYQKHLIFRTHVNYSPELGIYIQYGEEGIHLTRELIDIYKLILKLKHEGFSWGEIFFGNLKKENREKFNLEEWNLIQEKIEPYRKTNVFDFIMRATPSENCEKLIE